MNKHRTQRSGRWFESALRARVGRFERRLVVLNQKQRSKDHD